MTRVESLFHHRIVKQFQRTASLFRLRPFDVTSAAGRTDERHRRAALTALAAALARSISIATALVTVPLTLHYLGAERYGMWMTMSSVVAMLSFADFGIGNGIVNAVATAHGRDEPSAIKEYVSSSIFILSLIALAIVGIFAAFYSFVPWYEIFNVRSLQAQRDAGPALAVLIACFALAIPLGVVQRVQMGLQKGFMANLWQCGSSVLALGCVILAIEMKLGLPWLVLAFAGSPLVASLLNSIIYFGQLHRESAPAFRSISGHAMKEIAHIGILFFVLQVVGAIVFSSDNVIIAHYLGASIVSVYAVPVRLFSTIPMVLAMILAPLWPAYGEALARGDHDWAKRTMKRSLVISIGFAGIASFLLVLFGSPIIRAWVGNAVAPSFVLLLGLGLWQVIQAGGNAAAMFLNGANIVKFQVVVAIVTGAVSLILKVVMVHNLGVSGAIWSTIVAYMVCAAVPIYWKVSRLMLPQFGEQKPA